MGALSRSSPGFDAAIADVPRMVRPPRENRDEGWD